MCSAIRLYLCWCCTLSQPQAKISAVWNRQVDGHFGDLLLARRLGGDRAADDGGLLNFDPWGLCDGLRGCGRADDREFPGVLGLPRVVFDNGEDCGRKSERDNTGHTLCSCSADANSSTMRVSPSVIMRRVDSNFLVCELGEGSTE